MNSQMSPGQYKMPIKDYSCLTPTSYHAQGKYSTNTRQFPITSHRTFTAEMERPSLFAQVQRRSTQSRSHPGNPNHHNDTRAINTPVRRGGRLSKSMQQLTFSGLAPNSDEIRLKLLSKIPRTDNAFIDVRSQEIKKFKK
jgi:hypothetical protein